MSKSLIVYLVLLAVIIGGVYYGSYVWDEVDSKEDKEKNVTVINGIRGADLEQPEPLIIGEFKPVTEADLTEEEKVWVSALQDSGVYRMDNLILVNPIDKELHYTFVGQEKKEFEIQLVVKEASAEDRGKPLLGRMNMSDLFPIGIYNEDGEFLQ